ncbi:MAG: hypothetical protein ABIE22_01075 [archaeon]
MIKKAQITLFVIVGLIIIVAVIFYLIIAGKVAIDFTPARLPEPSKYLQDCIEENVIDLMMSQGGYIDPQNYKFYQGNKIAYLCYNQNFYYPCINQEPLYIRHLEEEIVENSREKINNCFDEMKKEFEQRGNTVVMGNSMQVDVELASRRVDFIIDRSVEISGQEEAKDYDGFNLVIFSPLYDLAAVAVEIVDQEAKYCNFEYIGYDLLHPGVHIERFTHGGNAEAAKIYFIEDKYTGKQLRIAVRGCIIPSGF